jgi:class 3 adenylate cyclase
VSSPPLKRRLTTILATDAVGYSRLMSESEEDTMRVLAAHRAVIDGIIQFHEGRIFDTAGDSVLAEFASPVEAVRCAVEMQDALKTRNDALPEERRMLFRIGINLGDVMVKGDDLLGDGVNVAARLESIAEPGGICISSSVYDQIAGKLNLHLTDIGEQALKNITRPIRTYRIQAAGLPPKPPAARPGRGKRTRRPWLAATLLALVATAVGAAIWQQLRYGAHSTKDRSPTSDQAAIEREKAAADAQRLRDEADAARRKAEADAAKIYAQAEAAKAQAEADALRAKAQADADALRAKAKAEADAQALRAKAHAEEADAERMKAEAAAAAEKARVAAAAPVPATAVEPKAAAAARYDGDWRLNLSCPPYGSAPARESNTVASISSGKVAAAFGRDGTPGYFNVGGTIDKDDSLVLQGEGVSGLHSRHYGREFTIFIPGRFDAGAYRGEGKFGGRRCVITLAR